MVFIWIELNLLKGLFMINRREFLKGLIINSFFNFMPGPLIANIKFHTDRKVESPQSVEPKERPRDKRIFCQVENEPVEIEIERCAKDIGCEVLYGEPFSPDILALGGFIYIIDRNFVGRDWWEIYVRSCDDYHCDEPCLIVDNIEDMELPKSNYVAQFDLSDPASITSILHAVTEARVLNVFKNSLK